MADPDTQLAETMGKAPVVLGFNLVGNGGEEGTAIRAGFAVIGARGEDPYRFVDNFPAAVSALPPNLQAARGNGFVNEPSDWDNIVRRVPLVLRLGDRPVPSLAAESVARRVRQRAAICCATPARRPKRAFGENTGLNAIEIQVPEANTTVRCRPTRPDDVTAPLRRRRDPRRYISAADVLSGKFDRETESPTISCWSVRPRPGSID